MREPLGQIGAKYINPLKEIDARFLGEKKMQNGYVCFGIRLSDGVEIWEAGENTITALLNLFECMIQRLSRIERAKYLNAYSSFKPIRPSRTRRTS